MGKKLINVIIVCTLFLGVSCGYDDGDVTIEITGATDCVYVDYNIDGKKKEVRLDSVPWTYTESVSDILSYSVKMTVCNCNVDYPSSSVTATIYYEIDANGGEDKVKHETKSISETIGDMPCIDMKVVVERDVISKD